MIEVGDLPAVNALLNSTSAICLLVGFIFIKRKQVRKHRWAMLGAMTASALFLTSYLIYHYHVGSKPFTGQGPVRVVYFSILISHTVLAAAIVPLVLITVTKAFRRKFASHRRIARWTLPLWAYVSLTGVVVYWMLYQL